MALAIAYLSNNDPRHRILIRLAIGLFLLDAFIMLLYMAVSPTLEPFLIVVCMFVFNVLYAPITMILRRNRSRAWTVWNMLTQKAMSLAGAFGMLDRATIARGQLADEDSTADDSVLLVLFVMLMITLYTAEMALLLYMLIRSQEGQADRAYRYTARRLLDLMRHGHTTATYVAAGIHRQLEKTRELTSKSVDQINASLKQLSILARKQFTVSLVRMSLAPQHFAVLATFVLSLALAAFFLETTKIISRQQPIFANADVLAMNKTAYNIADPTTGMPMRMPRDTRLHTDNKVLIVVMDGLRLDYLDRLAFWEENDFGTTGMVANDFASFAMRNQLPSMSVPNWLTTLTGAPPEMTGVLGNMFVPDTHFESVYSAAKHAGVMRMVTGTPWFAGIIADQLPFLRGDGTIDAGYNTQETTASSSAPSDKARTQVGLDAIRYSGPDPYGLMLVHFSDIDSQGHCCGVGDGPESNYEKSIRTKRDHLRQLLAELQPGTVALIVSDHGHLNRGGHGGIDERLRRIPFVVYSKGSNLSNVTHAETATALKDPEQAGRRVFNNTDVAPTVCALLGIPVPGQAMGNFIEPVVERFVPNAAHRRAHWNDLIAARIGLMTRFYEVWVQGLEDTDPDLDNDGCDTPVDAAACNSRPADESCLADTQALTHHYMCLRDKAHSSIAVWLAALLCIVFGVGSTLLLEFTTSASPLSLCCRAQRADLRSADSMHGGKLARELAKISEADALEAGAADGKETDDPLSPTTPLTAGTPMSSGTPTPRRLSRASNGTGTSTPSNERKAVQDEKIARYFSRHLASFTTTPGIGREIRARNITALVWTGVGTVLYYGISIAVYNVFYIGFQKYQIWDSTVIHAPRPAQLWLAMVLGPSTILAFCFTRCYAVYYHKKLPGASPSLRFRRLMSDSFSTFTDAVVVHLCDQYLLLWSVWACLVTLTLASNFTFVLPGVLQQPFVDDARWAFRFRVVTVLGFNLPMVLMGLYKTWSWDWSAVPYSSLDAFLRVQGLYVPKDLLGKLHVTRDRFDARVRRVIGKSALSRRRIGHSAVHDSTGMLPPHSLAPGMAVDTTGPEVRAGRNEFASHGVPPSLVMTPTLYEEGVTSAPAVRHSGASRPTAASAAVRGHGHMHGFTTTTTSTTRVARSYVSDGGGEVMTPARHVFN